MLLNSFTLILLLINYTTMKIKIKRKFFFNYKNGAKVSFKKFSFVSWG